MCCVMSMWIRLSEELERARRVSSYKSRSLNYFVRSRAPNYFAVQVFESCLHIYPFAFIAVGLSNFCAFSIYQTWEPAKLPVREL